MLLSSVRKYNVNKTCKHSWQEAVKLQRKRLNSNQSNYALTFKEHHGTLKNPKHPKEPNKSLRNPKDPIKHKKTKDPFGPLGALRKSLKPKETLKNAKEP